MPLMALPPPQRPDPKVEAALLAALPRGLVPPRSEVPAERNGWPVALRAGKGASLSVEASKLLMKDSFDAADRALARKTLKAAEPRLKLLAQALARPVWLQPKAKEPFLDFPNYSRLKELAKLLVLRANLALTEGRPDAAVADLLAARELGRRVADSDGFLIGHLVGEAMRSIASRALQRAAGHPNMTSGALRAALAKVPEGGKSDPLLARSEVSEVRETIRGLAALPKGSAAGDGIAGDVYRGHPNPFDRVGTVRLIARGLRIALANTARSWKDQEDLGAFADSLNEGLPPEDDDFEDVKPTKAQIAAYRAAVRKVDNPLGRTLAASSISIFNTIARVSFKARADDSATRATLLLALAARENGGALPRALPEPVRDPFSGGVLLYDPDRALLWSVGPDGRDDRGDGPPGTTKGRDIVWSARGLDSAADRARTKTPPPAR